MNDEAQRDVDESTFGAILARINAAHREVMVAVFFDDQGETIDYWSQLDPYDTRLTAAHQGVVVCSAIQRMSWLGMGVVEALEVQTDRTVTLTIPVGGGTFLTVVSRGNELTPELNELLDEVIVQLRLEAGI
jgi:predicted regulator of Ras-like GTPase activity (Roadblock/LC7/MglB family)